MITQKELIQRRADFWKAWFLEQTRHELNMTIGLVKSMTNNAYVSHGENDDTGLYQASMLAENRLDNFTKSILESKIDFIVDELVNDFYSLTNSQT